LTPDKEHILEHDVSILGPMRMQHDFL